jgi:predicted ATPase/class 3 adenylate cyclase
MLIPGFTVDERLHRGAVASVYRARRNADGSPVVLKVLTDEFPDLRQIARLNHEYSITHDLHLPGVVRALAIERHENKPILVREDFGGPSLRALKAGELEIRVALRIGAQLAEILSGLHEHDVVHKDLRPHHVLVELDTSRVAVTDFGIASRFSVERQQIAHPNQLDGSLPYMSPEQTGRINRNIDYRTDFYSLGVTLYELLTGTLPFTATDPLELIHAHLAMRPTPPAHLRPAIPSVLSDIVLKLLAKTAEERYQSARAIRLDLEAALQDLDAGVAAPRRVPQRDVADRFRFPQRLYGREREVAALESAFERAAQGPAELLLVSGYAGIGKSALVREVHDSVRRRGGYFVSSKYDQLQRNAPYSALAQAFRELVRQLLAEDEPRLAAWRTQFEAALGTIGGVLVDLVPDVEMIVGPQPTVPPLGPMEARNRFNFAWQRFIELFTSDSRPLVLFLDDLQWADSASLNLLRHLFTNSAGKRLLLVGAYRDNEVGPAHPLMLIQEDIAARGARVSHIILGGLEAEHVESLIADAFESAPEMPRRLAAVVFAKTHGNPFFIQEFLRTIYQERLLIFDRKHGLWTCDVDLVEGLGITDNVADLMTTKIEKLAPAVQNVLKVAACVGNSFDLRTLSTVLGQPLAETGRLLREIVRAGLVQPISDARVAMLELEDDSGVRLADRDIPVCRFLHDRVQQAAYALLTPEEAAGVHLRIGMLLRRQFGSDETIPSERIFEVVDHLNMGAHLVDSAAERQDLAGLNLIAGRGAKAAAAYQVARSYFSAGAALLADDTGKLQQSLAFELSLERAESEYLSGSIATADAMCDALLRQATNDRQRTRIYLVKITLYTSLSRYREAVQIGIEAVRSLGVRLPVAPGQGAIALEFLKARWYLRGKRLEDLGNLPPMTDERQLSIMVLLSTLVAPAFLSNEAFAIVISLKMFNASLKYGISSEAPYAYMVYGVVNAGLGKFDTAYEFGRLGLALNERLGNKRIQPILHFLFATAINHWKSHSRTNMEHLRTAYEKALEVGDLVYADYALITLVVNSLFKGDAFDETLNRCEQYLDFFRRTKGLDYLATAQGQAAIVQRQEIACLKGETQKPTSLTDENFDEETCVELLHADLARFEYYRAKLQILYLLGDYKVVPEFVLLGKKTLEIIKITADVRIPEYVFYHALLLSSLCSSTTGRARARHFKMLRQQAKKLQRWARSCPENFLPRHLLVAAEIERLRGRHLEAADLYDAAIRKAREQEFVHVEAAANELAARFYLARGKDRFASGYFEASRYAYSRWGAARKVRALEEQYPALLASSAPGDRTGVLSGQIDSKLDLITVMKASEAISIEIELPRLVDKLMQILIENVGAERGVLVLDTGDSLEVKAERSAGTDASVTALRSIPVQDHPALPAGVIHYVVRTREPVVLADAARQGLFTQDPYIVRQRPKSVLCTPLTNQGKLTGLLYLENYLTADAFTTERVNVLNLLSGQIAISLENARLYERQVQMTESATRFVPHEFLLALDKRSLIDAHLGDCVQMDMTILFTDIVGSTSLSERMTPRETFEFINAYFEQVGPVIRRNCGFIGKYTGDGVMALFPRRADDAVRAAVEIRQRLFKYNEQQTVQGRSPIDVGIGVHKGTAMLGIVGEAERLQGDLIADAANVASRLEGLCRSYCAGILLSDRTFHELQEGNQFRSRSLGTIRVKGREREVGLIEICDGDPEEVAASKWATRHEFAEALALYTGGDVGLARGRFAGLLDRNSGDGAARFYLDRIDGLTHPTVGVRATTTNAQTRVPTSF